MADNLSAVRAQGREAKSFNDDNADPKTGESATGEKLFTEHDCPYGPGDARDAWIAGFGGAAEEVRQADLSEGSSDDVRHVEPKTVREGKKPGGKTGKTGKTGKAKREAAKDQTAVIQGGTGTAETAQVTKVEQAKPELADTVPVAETVIGDPGASTSAAEQTITPVSENTDASLM